MPEKTVTMQQFGHWGRFANQLFQYALLSGYAKRHALQLQLPPWVGGELFGLETAPVTLDLPPLLESNDCTQQAFPPHDGELTGRDFRGYAQYHTSFYAEDKERIRDLFQPVPDIRRRLEPAINRLRASGDSLIGIHLRRGDYGRNIFPIIPTSWYLAWLKEHWGRFKGPVLLIATETPALVEEFDDYAPVTTEGLGVQLKTQRHQHYNYLPRDTRVREPWQLDFYPDFYLLQHCDVIVAPSSTFSFMAAMLNPVLLEFWRASLALEGFERLDPWNAYPLLHEDVRDYSHLEGIELKENPYW